MGKFKLYSPGMDMRAKVWRREGDGLYRLKVCDPGGSYVSVDLAVSHFDILAMVLQDCSQG